MDRSMRVDFARNDASIVVSTSTITTTSPITSMAITSLAKVREQPTELEWDAWYSMASLMAPIGLMLVRLGMARRERVVHEAIKALTVSLVASLCYWCLGYSWSNPDCLDFSRKSEFVTWCTHHLANWTHNKTIWPILSVGVIYVVSLANLAGLNKLRLSLELYVSLWLSILLFPFVHRLCYQRDVWMQRAGFRDQGAAGLVHLMGGASCLVLLLVRSRSSLHTSSYDLESPDDHMALMKSGHNLIIVFLGHLLHIFGILAFNLTFFGQKTHFYSIFGNSLLAATTAGLCSLMLNRVLIGKYSLLRIMSGMTAGLVTCSSNIASLSPYQSTFLGLLAAIIYTLMRQLVRHWLRLNDLIDVISQHLAPALLSLSLVTLLNNETNYTWTLVGCLLIFALTILVLLLALLPVILCGCNVAQGEHEEELRVRESVVSYYGHNSRQPESSTWRPGAEVTSDSNPIFLTTLGTSMPDPLLASTTKGLKLPRLVVEQPTPMATPMATPTEESVLATPREAPRPPNYFSLNKKPPLISASSTEKIEHNNDNNNDDDEAEVFTEEDARLRITRSAVRGQLQVLRPQDRLQRESFSTRRDITP